jgi:hypothetical protein
MKHSRRTGSHHWDTSSALLSRGFRPAGVSSPDVAHTFIDDTPSQSFTGKVTSITTCRFGKLAVMYVCTSSRPLSGTEAAT